MFPGRGGALPHVNPEGLQTALMVSQAPGKWLGTLHQLPSMQKESGWWLGFFSPLHSLLTSPFPSWLGKVFSFFKKKSFQRGFVVIHETKTPIVGCIAGPSPPPAPATSPPLTFSVSCFISSSVVSASSSLTTSPCLLSGHYSCFSLLSLLRWDMVGRWEERKTRPSGEKCQYASALPKACSRTSIKTEEKDMQIPRPTNLGSCSCKPALQPSPRDSIRKDRGFYPWETITC